MGHAVLQLDGMGHQLPHQIPVLMGWQLQHVLCPLWLVPAVEYGTREQGPCLLRLPAKWAEHMLCPPAPL